METEFSYDPETGRTLVVSRLGCEVNGANPIILSRPSQPNLSLRIHLAASIKGHLLKTLYIIDDFMSPNISDMVVILM
jgi:hypothetical protein